MNKRQRRVKTKTVSVKTCFVCRSKSHLIKDCDYYVKKENISSKLRAHNSRIRT